MNDSPSSEVFSQEIGFTEVNLEAMDASFSYETLVKSTKACLSKNVCIDVKKTSFQVIFSNLIEDCNICVNQSLELILSLLEGDDIKYIELQEFMGNCISLLKLLSNYLKNVMEIVPMACCTMKSFPTVTGQIIYSVFKHCKSSEMVYGNVLSIFEKELKDLFRTCHELQLTYLMILDKHFIFDLSEREEMDVLIHALEINLNIADLVHTLDIKTMGEQWKGVVLLCEKYATLLVDKQIFMNSSKILLNMIHCYLEKCMEDSQDEKATVRSLKMVFFAVKLLLRVSKLLKQATAKNYKDIVGTLCYLYLHDPAYLQLTNKLQSLLSLYTTHVTKPAEILVKELVLDDQFVECLLDYNLAEIQKDDLVLGYVLLLLSTTRALKQNNMAFLEAKKLEVFNKIFNCVPSSHVWCHLDLRLSFEDDKPQCVGLFEYLFIHAVALAVTFDVKQYCYLERKLFEALLSTDCMSAIFASNLWVALARKSNPLLTSEQVYTLCRIYQKMEKHKLFQHSPQETHLRHTITNLFKTIAQEERLNIVNKLNVCDDRNSGIWNVLKIENIPDAVQKKAEKGIAVKLKSKLERFLSLDDMSIDEFLVLIDTMKLAASCSTDLGHNIQGLIVKCWLKVCPKNEIINLTQSLDRGQMWYYQFVEALISFTRQNMNMFCDDLTLVQVLHVMSNIMDTENTELSLLCINLIIDMLKYSSADRSTDNNLLVRKIVTSLLRNEVTSKTLYYKLKERKDEYLIASLVNEDSLLFEEWNKLEDFNDKNDIDLKELLVSVVDNQFQHKCIPCGQSVMNCDNANVKKTCSSNFDFADVDSLFDIENSEPDCKKIKLQRDDIESIIARIESETNMLSKIEKGSISIANKKSIKNICYKLNSIIN